MGADPDQEQEALRLKSIAESKFTDSNLKSALKHAKKAHRLRPELDGISSMLTAFKILRVASKAQSGATDWYKILQVEPFSHINTIKTKYKKLALILHPDKNPHLGCEDAFKLVGEGFRVLSDRVRRKEYDMKLRIRLQEERVNGGDSMADETFWTACSRCRLLHQFERRYLGHSLVCPSCKKSFEAVEVDGVDKNDVDDGVTVGVNFRSERLRKKFAGGDLGLNQKLVDLRGKLGGGKGIADSRNRKKNDSMGKVGKVDLEGNMTSDGEMDGVDLRKKVDGCAEVVEKARNKNLEGNDGGEWGGGRLRTVSLRRKTSIVDQIPDMSKSKRAKCGDDMMTLAEMQLEVKKKAMVEKAKLKEKERKIEEEEKKRHVAEKKSINEIMDESRASRRSARREVKTDGVLKKSENLKLDSRSASRKNVSLKTENRDKRSSTEVMAVEDSDFYDFDRDRVERSFKKGQVWAIYDDDDGMPRHYGLMDEVVSVNPFQVDMSWLDLQSNGDEELIVWEKMGFHVSCGKFKVSKKTIVNSLNIFSHVVESERAAREVYRIYPKKGSVWALYREAELGGEGRNLSAGDGRGYDLIVVLSTYSEMHGLSIAYLEKVDGFKSVFKRQEIGCHAVRLLNKDEVRLFSHQIPARKMSGNDVPDLLKDCWELDPASLPSDLLVISSRR